MRRSGQTADSVHGMSRQDRCIHYGFPDLFAGYMSVYRIVQTPEYVAIQLEKIHDTRIIPLDGRPHLSSAVDRSDQLEAFARGGIRVRAPRR